MLYTEVRALVVYGRDSILCLLCSTKENLSRQCREFLEDQRSQNVVYCEVRLCPYLFCQRGLTPEEVTTTVLEALESAQTEFNVVVRVLLCFLKPYKGESQKTQSAIFIHYLIRDL